MTMVERAARALAREIGEPIVSHATIRKDWSRMTDLEHKALRFGARDALLAALDAEDIALREALLPFMGGDTAVDASENARAAILALKSLAQGA